MNTLKPLLDFYTANGGVEQAWIQGTHARDVEGNSVSMHDANAKRWCLVGALGFLNANISHPNLSCGDIYREFRRRAGIVSVLTWNDRPGRTWKDVQQLLEMDDKGRL